MGTGGGGTGAYEGGWGVSRCRRGGGGAGVGCEGGDVGCGGGGGCRVWVQV